MGCSPTKGCQRQKKDYLIENVTDHRGGINCMALSDDGSLLVTGSEDMTARMWSTQTNPIECIGILRGHKGYITCCAIHEQFVVTGAADNTLRKWYLVTGECLFVYEGHEGRISRVICTGDFIFSTSYDRTARAWLFEAQEIQGEYEQSCLRIFEGHTKPIYPIIFIPDEDNPLSNRSICENDIVITGSADCTARSWSFYTGKCIKVFQGHSRPINTMAVDNFGKTLFTAGGDRNIKSWNIETGEPLRELAGHEGPVICLLAHNRMLYSGSSDHTARAWVMEFGECTRIYRGHNHTVDCLRYLDGMLFTGSGDLMGRMYEAKSGTLKRVYKGHTNAIICMEVVPGKLFTGSYDGTLRVWDTSGVRDETVFGDFFENNEPEPEDNEDGEELKAAVKSLDPYLNRHY